MSSGRPQAVNDTTSEPKLSAPCLQVLPLLLGSSPYFMGYLGINPSPGGGPVNQLQVSGKGLPNFSVHLQFPKVNLDPVVLAQDAAFLTGSQQRPSWRGLGSHCE